MKVTLSPYSDRYEYEIDPDSEKKKIDLFLNQDRKTVVVQGLGFVGTAMVAALSLVEKDDALKYNVVGVDLADEANYWKIAKVNEGKSPIVTNDKSIALAFEKSKRNGNLLATYSEYAYSKADVIVIDIHLDIKKNRLGDSKDHDFRFESYQKAIQTVAENIKEDVLIIIETTVPPGTTEKVIVPIFRDTCAKRGLDMNKVFIAHSYERVMPGIDYLNSITNYFRVYSGINAESKLRAREFLESFINTNQYPLTELHSTTSSEMAKVLENSYRAMNIAFIQEWSEYAEIAEVNLLEVLKAIRVRSTHNNIMSPGFGVGGYCLTKDSLLADWSYHNLFGGGHLGMSLEAINVNDLMPLHTFDLIKKKFPDLNGKSIAILGVSYISDVADTRYSPAQLFYEKCIDEGMKVFLHDPIVSYWDEVGIKIEKDIEKISIHKVEIVVFTVRHEDYLQMSASAMVQYFPYAKLFVDAFNIIDDTKASDLSNHGISVIGVGKGHWSAFNRKNQNG